MIEQTTYKVITPHHSLKKGTKLVRDWSVTLLGSYRILSLEEITEIQKFAIDERIRRRDKYYSFLDETKTCEIYFDYLYCLGIVEKITRRKDGKT